MNSGEQAIINLAQARLDQLKLSMSEVINTMLYKDGTGNTGKDFLGLRARHRRRQHLSVASTGPRPATSTGRPRSVAGGATNATLVAGDADRCTTPASEGSDHPTNIITTQATFEVYEEQLVDQARYTDMEMADAGFQNLLFKGTADRLRRRCRPGRSLTIRSGSSTSST